jgi:hypothetical protein
MIADVTKIPMAVRAKMSIALEVIIVWMEAS